MDISLIRLLGLNLGETPPSFMVLSNVETGFSSSRVRLFVHLIDWILENYGG